MNIYRDGLQKNIRDYIVFRITLFPWHLFLVGHFNVSFAYLVAHFKLINFLLMKCVLPPFVPATVCLYLHSCDKESQRNALSSW